MDKVRTLTLDDFNQTIDEAKVTEINIMSSDKIRINQTLIVIETNKTTVELGSPNDGVVSKIHVKVGDSITQNTDLCSIETHNILEDVIEITKNTPESIETDLVIVGAGPAGYTAAFRAADLGLKTVLIDKYPELGGTCLNSGCIPSKFLLHIVSGVHNAQHLSDYGVKYDEPYVDLRKMMQAKDNVINTLNMGLKSLKTKRNIKFIQGEAKFLDVNTLSINTGEHNQKVKFSKAIIATGSVPRKIPTLDIKDSRIKYSEQALNIQYIPERMLVVGGGVIGLELASVYHGLGSKVSIIEASDTILGMFDNDMVDPLLTKYENCFESVLTNTVIDNVDVSSSILTVKLKLKSNYITEKYDSILIATGRVPNTHGLNLDAIHLNTDEFGFISVSRHYETSIDNIYAIGDVIGNPMLAHKGSYEGRIVAEVCAGARHGDDSNEPLLPFVVYTEPEIAWVGMTEKQKNDDIEVVKTSWSANGRALTQDSSYGLTKLLVNRHSGVIVGGGLVGPNVGEMLTELTLLIQKKITVQELAAIIHPHPTISETIGMCAEIYLKEAIEVINIA